MAEVNKLGDKRAFEIKVNGVQIEVEEEKLRASRVLEIAKESGAMPGNPEDYLLQGDKRLYKAEDWVNFEEDNQFITIPDRPTQVA